MLDPEDRNILVVFGDRRIQIFQGSDRIPVLNGLELELTSEQIFNWLSF
ncbi:hypothetical protein [Pseudanabaena sp. PCC 6802]|nr:hypothetical protein [Pseudanabaena sp. PCC 6802]